jgi:ribosomal protein S19
MNILQSILLVGASASLLLAAPQTKQDKELQSVIKTGKSSSKILLKTLGKNMKKHMKKGGVMDALNFCTKEAYTLTEKVNTKLPKGVQAKRISANYRNPSNTPTENELKILNSLQALQESHVILPKFVIEKVGMHTYKFYKPLVITKKVCLKCHGDVKDIDLKRAISKNYPLDKAMGYKMGDLRGAIVITIKK